MAGDVLNDPLGRTLEKRKVSGSVYALRAVSGLAVVFLLCAVGYVGLRQPTPAKMGVTVPIAARQQTTAASSSTETAKASAIAPPGSMPRGDEIDAQSGVKIIRPPGFSTNGGGTFIKVPQDFSVALKDAPDPRLVEKSRYGLLPRIGPDGARASEVYARPLVTDAGLKTDAPRIALVVGGMGLNAASTTAASDSLPPAVTLGFAPYGNDLDRQVRNARTAGHEAVLQIPMEPSDASDQASMQRMLSTTDPTKETLDRLHWIMTRFTGYAGVMNFLGGKFTADADALAPVLHDVAGRGLFYLDDGSSPRSLVGTLGQEQGLPVLRVDVVIDAQTSPEAVRAALSKLEQLARTHRSAIGFASGLPQSTEQVVLFAKDLARRGISLVPLSALVSDNARTKDASTP